MSIGDEAEQEGPLFVTLAFDTEPRMDMFLDYLRDQFLNDYYVWVGAQTDDTATFVPTEVNVDGEPPEMLATFEWQSE